MGQVGQTSLAVVPTMKRFRQKVNAESRAAVKGAGRSMSAEFGKQGVAAGRSLGRGFRAGTSDVQRALQETTRANASATSAWSAANRKHLDTLGQVRVAQAKLTDVVQRYGEGSSQAVAAQERLGAAQRRAEESGVRLAAAQARMRDTSLALKAAQESANAAATSGVWKRMAADLAPVSQRISAVVNRVREWGGSSRLLQPFRSALNGLGSELAKSTLAAYNFGSSLTKRVGAAATAAGRKVSGAFNGLLAKSPALNTAVTKISNAVKSVGQSVRGAGSVFGSLGAAAATGAAGVARALGPGLSAAWAGLKSQVSSAASAFTNVLGGAATAAGLVIAGAMTKAAVGGFSRLSNIENAEAKMRGLGFAAADIDAAMAGASDAVDGTAFALDEMASSASVAMAAGLKPGEELNGYMKTLKNAAAAANVPLGDMGAILNKTVTAGKAYTTEINQIADRGLPIWTKLQEAYGVTADELRDMVSRGEVDSDTFLRVMDEMTGSVADAMGGTTQASIRNFGTALSKLGADMLQGLYPVIGPLFGALKAGVQMIQTLGAPAFAAWGEAMAPLADKLKAFTDAWAVAKADIAAGAEPLERIKQVFADFGINLEGPMGVLSKFSEIWSSLGAALTPIIGGLVGALGPLAARLPMIGGAFSGLTGPVGIFIGLLISVWQQSEAFRNAVMGTFQALMDALAPVFAQLQPLFEVLGTVFAQVAEVVGNVLASALTAITPLFEPLGSIIATILGAVTPLLPIFGTMAELLGGILVTAITALTPLFTFIGEVLTMLEPIITMVAGVIGQLLGALLPLLEPIGQLIGALLPPLIDLFITVLGPIMSLVGVIIGALLPVIQGLVEMLSGLINFVVGVFTGNWEQAWNGIQQFFGGFVDAIAGLVGGIGDIIGGIYDTIMSVLGGIGDWLVDSGKALIQGFIDGITGMLNAVGDAIGGVMDFIGGFFPNSPAKRGPLSGAGWRRLRNSGAAYIDQWTAGVEEGAQAFDLSSLVSTVNNVPSLRGALAGAAAGPQARVVQAEVPVQVNMMERDPERVGRAIGRGLEEALGSL